MNTFERVIRLVCECVLAMTVLLAIWGLCAVVFSVMG